MVNWTSFSLLSYAQAALLGMKHLPRGDLISVKLFPIPSNRLTQTLLRGCHRLIIEHSSRFCNIGLCAGLITGKLWLLIGSGRSPDNIFDNLNALTCRNGVLCA